MKYGIYFNNNSDNSTILSALEVLENTFFVENSSGESEKNTTDDDENTSDEEITSMNKNFENLHLNNFEFIENTDNYIEDKVYDDLKLKVKKVFESGKCSCNPNCFEKIGYERFLECRVEFEGLDKTMRDMVIKGQLIAFQKDKGITKDKNIPASIFVLIIIFQSAVLHTLLLLVLVIII
jgi:hypothetical protein